MSKTDFLSWDNDIDLDALLGEYTEDDDRDKVLAKTSKRTQVLKVTSVQSATRFLRLLPESAYESSLTNIAKDPIYNLFGENKVSLLCSVVSHLPVIQQFFLQIFLEIFSSGTNLCSAADRELLFTRFHQTRLSKKFTHGYMLLLVTLIVTT